MKLSQNSLNILRVDEIVEYEKPREEKVSRTNGLSNVICSKVVKQVDERHLFCQIAGCLVTLQVIIFVMWGWEERYVNKIIRSKRSKQGKWKGNTQKF